MFAQRRIAVLIPCRNEAATVARVVHDFRAALPGCAVYVYDNGSTDETGELARAAGAVVRFEPHPGKGGVVRRMFAEIDADVYLLVDGDATYDAMAAPDLVRTLVDGDLDMVTAVRDQEGRGAAYPPGHHFGNRAFSALLGGLFGTRPTDLFSGYRAFSRRFVKSFPATSRGFEIETELTIHALEQRISLAERSTRYFERPRGSVSKLATYRDGMRILGKTIMLFKDVKPATFFGGFAVLFGVAGLLLGIGVIMEFMETRYVTRLPTAVLATGLVLLAFLALTCGLILDSVTRGRRESKRMAYLAAGSADTRWSGEMMLRRSNQALAGTHAFPPGHYHSPIVDPEELKKRQDAMWTGDDPLLGIDLNDQVHRRILTEVFPKYIAEFDYPVELDCAPGPASFYVNNSQFGWLDASVLFVLLREWAPKRIIEVGSGYSSLLMADVNRRFLHGQIDITCIEPNPRDFLRGEIPGIARVLQRNVQDVPLEIFRQLARGDVLFIDSSHVAKTGSDVNYLMFQVLPRLAPGVRVHIHDIFFPSEYPKDWVLRENRSWNEQYVVRALLMYSSAFKLVFGSSIAYHRHPEFLRTALRQSDGAILGGGSLWIEKRDDQ